MRTLNYSHSALTNFAAVAEAFCDTVENLDRQKPEALLNEIHRLLPQAYAAALQLPDNSVLFDGSDESPEAEPDAAPTGLAPPQGLTQLGAFLGLRRFYREVFDPYAEASHGEVTGDVIDDLGDIYRELKRGLVYWHDGRSGAALWEWRFNFQIHWAEHATSALRALFALSAWYDVPWPSGAARVDT